MHEELCSRANIQTSEFEFLFHNFDNDLLAGGEKMLGLVRRFFFKFFVYKLRRIFGEREREMDVEI